MTKEDIKEVWITDDAVWLRTNCGAEACEEFRNFPRLNWATQKQRENYELMHYGIHWEEIDEDLSYEGFFRKKKPSNILYNVFITHPELNASAVARRLGIAQSLLAQYISGAKKPSKEREEAILNEIRLIGSELQTLSV